jgi:integrase
MAQAGQVFELKRRGPDGDALWAYRYRPGGRDSKRVQRGDFPTKDEARAALDRALERARREQRRPTRQMTLAELVDEYLAQHEVEAGTTEKLRWLLNKAVAAFGEQRVDELQPAAIAAWRMNIPFGHRFEATQALRQVLARAVIWGLVDTNAAKLGVENPQRRPREMRPFDTWADLETLAGALGPRYGPMVIFAAATGLRPGEWIALEHRDIDRDASVAYVRRACINGRVKCPKTEGSVRAVPLQTIALAALDRLPATRSALLFPSPTGAHLDLHNFRNREWKPGQRRVGIEPPRRVYDLRHTYATFALRAGLSTFDLSRYMGASLTMIDRHYGHLAHDGRQHAIRLLDTHAAEQATATVDTGGRSVDTATTRQRRLLNRETAH